VVLIIPFSVTFYLTFDFFFYFLLFFFYFLLLPFFFYFLLFAIFFFLFIRQFSITFNQKALNQFLLSNAAKPSISAAAVECAAVFLTE
jgi:hypothetical protein